LNKFVLVALIIGCSTNATAQQLTLLQPTNSNKQEFSCRVINKDQIYTHIRLLKTFEDNFKGPQLSNKWVPYYKGGDADPTDIHNRSLHDYTHEQEIYVDPSYKGLGLNPFEFKGSILKIHETHTPTDLLPNLDNLPFISGAISSKFSQLYGYFEITARLPKGKGLWPAFWLVTPDHWPPEIDVFENYDGGDPTKLWFTTHWGKWQSELHKYSSCGMIVPTSDTSFHSYGVLWNKNSITYFIDKQPKITMSAPSDLTEPMIMQANLGVSSMGDDTTPPATMDISNISAYQIIP
jgi:hypothetical protein